MRAAQAWYCADVAHGDVTRRWTRSSAGHESDKEHPMLKWLIRKRLTAFENKFGYDVSYARDILATDTRALFAFARAAKLGHYHRDIPRDPYWCAKLLGTVNEDCGPCTQLGVTMALAEGVDPKALAATLAGDDAALTDDVRIAVRFARAVLAHAPEIDELRAEIERRWGPRAVLSIAFGLAAARVYPTVKYALGHGKACQRVTVAGERIAVVRGPREAAA